MNINKYLKVVLLVLACLHTVVLLQERDKRRSGTQACVALPSVLVLEGSVLKKERQERVEEIDQVIKDAATAEGNIGGIYAKRNEGIEKMREAEKVLAGIGKDKRSVRMKIAYSNQILDDFEEKFGVDPRDEERFEEFVNGQKEYAITVIKRYARIQYLSQARAQTLGYAALSKLLGISIGQQLEEDIRLNSLNRLRIRTFAAIGETLGVPEKLAELREGHESLLESYHASLSDYDSAKREVQLSNAQLTEIKRVMAAAEQQVRNLQLELAEYDERIRTRAEQELIKMGLRSERSSSGTPRFIWPVIGRITAGFMSASYQAYFGIPHKAIDIAQPQGSIVKAAADGIVYYVQRGGSRGYSYVLIGHRGGYATLYGHLMSINVKKGQDISKGQPIGLSGGTPGTSGAGLMTTGPHLHFEVIKKGVYLNPLSVLP